MASDPTTERLRSLVAQITYLTTKGEIHWERQLDSAHRYARWNNNLLILGPDVSRADQTYTSLSLYYSIRLSRLYRDQFRSNRPWCRCARASACRRIGHGPEPAIRSI